MELLERSVDQQKTSVRVGYQEATVTVRGEQRNVKRAAQGVPPSSSAAIVGLFLEA